MLPLAEDATIALCGPNADRAKLGGGGSSAVTPFVQVSPLDGLRERAIELTFERGLAPIEESSLFDAFAPEGETGESNDGEASSGGLETDAHIDSGSEASIEDAVAAAETADCAIVVVEDDTTEGEDRSDLQLPGGQDSLVSQVAAAADRTIVVCQTSGPVEMPWVEDIDALLETWYPGQADGAALADVLYGDRDPGGRLPVTFGHSAAAYPTAREEVFPGVEREARYDEGVFVGYRYFDREGTDPLFPFGHGLSYAEFEYGDPAIESVDSDDTSNDTGSGPTVSSAGSDTDLPVEVTVPVRNVGDRAGSDVVQVYVGESDPIVSRPERELKRFARVHLTAGERRDVAVELDRGAFAYYNADEGWVVSPGTFEVAVGRSSRDVRGEISIEIE